MIEWHPPNLVFGVLMWNRIIAGTDKRQLVFWAVYLGLGVLFFLIFYVWIPQAKYRSKVMESKRNTHAVQLALERFSVDWEGDYPYDFAEVIAQGYVREPIINPFTGQPIKVVANPEDALSGDVVYIPIRSWDSSPGRPDAYELKVGF